MKQERIQHDQIRELLTVKGQENEVELDQQVLKIRLAQEAEAEFWNKNSRLKTNCISIGKDIEQANETIAELTNGKAKVEREAKLLEARISGYEARANDNELPSRNEEQLAELLYLHEVLLDGKEKEVQGLKEKIKELETEKEGSERLQLSHERGASTMRSEIKRLSKVEAQYFGMMESHHGGSAEKFRAFMRTTTLSADCPEAVVQRWRDLNNFKLDEENMLLLTKLICSERVMKSRALLIDFIRSTLDFEVVEENHQDGANSMTYVQHWQYLQDFLVVSW